MSIECCFENSEHGRGSRKRWKEPGKVPGEEAMEAESSRGCSKQREYHEQENRTCDGECAHVCTCMYLCEYVHTCVRDGLYSHGLSMYTMPTSVGHGQQTCA